MHPPPSVPIQMFLGQLEEVMERSPCTWRGKQVPDVAQDRVTGDGCVL